MHRLQFQKRILIEKALIPPQATRFQPVIKRIRLDLLLLDSEVKTGEDRPIRTFEYRLRPTKKPEQALRNTVLPAAQIKDMYIGG